ncbi:MAG: DM13 domain-containing protein [Nitrososphaeraceae archaeon]
MIFIDGANVARLEDLIVTNGPDLYVYLSTDKSASDIVNLGRLKANIGNQNYQIPEGIDMTCPWFPGERVVTLVLLENLTRIEMMNVRKKMRIIITILVGP